MIKMGRNLVTVFIFLFCSGLSGEEGRDGRQLFLLQIAISQKRAQFRHNRQYHSNDILRLRLWLQAAFVDYYFIFAVSEAQSSAVFYYILHVSKL